MIIKRVAIFFLLGMLSLSSFPQSDQYFFSRLDITHGLSNNQVNCFYKDKRGFLWVGTVSGLNRFDGYQFNVIRHDPQDTMSLTENFVSRMFEGPGDKLWIETRVEFNLMDLKTEKVSRNIRQEFLLLGIEGAAVNDIKKDDQQNYWFLMDKQTLWRYPASGKKATPLFRAPAGNSIASFTFDKKGFCYIIYTNGSIAIIKAVNGQAVSSLQVPAMVFGKNLLNYSIFADSDNELWVYAQANNPKGVLRIDPWTGNYTLLEKDKGTVRLNGNIIASVVQDNKGDIWIGTDHGGANIYNKRTNSIRYLVYKEEENKSLSQNSIVSMYHDNNGFIWVGTFKKGISYYHENMIKLPLYRHNTLQPGSLSYDDVNCFAEDAKGNIWVGANGGGLNYFDRAANRFIPYVHDPANSNSVSNNVIVSLHIDRQEKLWIGSYYGGLDCYDGKKFTHYRHDPADSNSLSDDRVWEILEDSRGRLWVGTLGSGLDMFDRQRNVFVHYKPYTPNSIRANYVAALLEDKSGNIWIGTSDGLNILDTNGRFSYYQHDAANAKSISNNNVVFIMEDSKGLIWVGTHDGLNIYSEPGKKIATLHARDGIADNMILTIVEDDKGTVWISTPNGLTRITTTGNALDPLSFSFVNYDETDGLQGREFNENAALRTRKGELIFGGANGFNLFVPPSKNQQSFESPVVLTAFQVFNKQVGVGEELGNHVILPATISYTDKITLGYNENVFSIEFASLNFINTEKVKYAYKLEGFNDDWLYADASQRKATYTNLDPGTYIFHVKAMDSEGIWSEEAKTLTIKVLPPFWKTPLAYTLYIALAIALLYFARRMELQRTRKKFAIEEERKEAQRKHELDLMKIKFFTNVSHEFRTPLSLILAPIDKMLQQYPDAALQQQVQLLQRNAKRLLNLVNQLLDFRKMEEKELKLATTAGDIVSFTNEVTRSFTDIADIKHISFSFNSNTERFYTSFDQEKLERVLFNLLSNAFKFTLPNGHVDVRIRIDRQEQEQHQVRIEVRDTGIGIAADKQEKIFERFFQDDIPGSMVNQGSGIGLAITREFVRLHGGDITVESEPDKGSCFTIHLSLQQEEQPQVIASPVLADINDAGEAIVAATADEPRPFKKLPLVLLIEDNDDFRFYLKDNLRDQFSIIEAANGKTGWQKALAAHPDLIVSDVSMPEMNGIDLCKKIKADKRTSHIPVILLTALTGEEQQLRGLETGASDYMTKPFNFEILLNRIKNQLQQQQVFKKTYQKQVEVKQGQITVESPGDKFLQQVVTVIEKNIAEPDFTVEDLSRALFMSRVALYKRMLSITGKSPLEFIRDMRMQKAAQLLEKTNLTIAEVAYEVGFNNPKNFSKSFKASYTVLPSAYRQQKQQ